MKRIILVLMMVSLAGCSFVKDSNVDKSSKLPNLEASKEVITFLSNKNGNKNQSGENTNNNLSGKNKNDGSNGNKNDGKEKNNNKDKESKKEDNRPNDYSIFVLVTKNNPLSKDYKPNLKQIPADYAVDQGYLARPEVVDAYMQMVNAMKKETGMWMYVTSSYRGYESQQKLYNNYVKQHGEAQAKRMVAYPGTSEHQTGLVVDVVTPGGNMFKFGDTEQSKWVIKNAHRFGFIVRYEKQFENVTGYMAEPWHLRFIGNDAAEKVYNSGRPYDEYYNKYIKKN